jgi:hypothetical protein
LVAAKAALIAECAREEENALYTSTNFFIWLRVLRGVRALRRVGAGVCTGIGRALQIDAMIREYASAAGVLKNLQGEFRRARLVWSNEPWPEFKAEVRRLLKSVNDARKPSLTPPEWCFRIARRKIRAGHYTHAADETPT